MHTVHFVLYISVIYCLSNLQKLLCKKTLDHSVKSIKLLLMFQGQVNQEEQDNKLKYRSTPADLNWRKVLVLGVNWVVLMSAHSGVRADWWCFSAHRAFAACVGTLSDRSRSLLARSRQNKNTGRGLPSEKCECAPLTYICFHHLVLSLKWLKAPSWSWGWECCQRFLPNVSRSYTWNKKALV